jgi:hypothetical protein
MDSFPSREVDAKFQRPTLWGGLATEALGSQRYWPLSSPTHGTWKLPLGVWGWITLSSLPGVSCPLRRLTWLNRQCLES